MKVQDLFESNGPTGEDFAELFDRFIDEVDNQNSFEDGMYVCDHMPILIDDLVKIGAKPLTPEFVKVYDELKKSPENFCFISTYHGNGSVDPKAIVQKPCKNVLDGGDKDKWYNDEGEPKKSILKKAEKYGIDVPDAHEGAFEVTKHEGKYILLVITDD